MDERIKGLLFLIFCICCGVQDIRSRQIHMLTFLLFGASGMLCCFIARRSMGDLLLALLPGLILLLAACKGRDIIGTGDALWILTAALYMDVRPLLFTFSSACFLCVFIGLYMIFKSRFDLRRVKKTELPFTAILPIPLLLRLMI